MRGVAMNWGELARQQPRLATIAKERLVDPGVVLLGTIRRDGTPRISPVEPFLLDDEFWLCLLWKSTKAADLLRDPRVLVHSIVTDRDGKLGEVKLRGRAVPVDDEATQARYAEAAGEALGWHAEVGRFHLFRVEIDDLTYLHYSETGDQHLTQWPSGREQVRRLTSATSVGPAEPVRDLLVGQDAG